MIAFTNARCADAYSARACSGVTFFHSACTASLNPEIVSLGRDLYYNTRCSNPGEAIEQSRFALTAALKAMDEGDG